MGRLWFVRGGDENRLVDDFVDDGVIGMGYYGVSDGRTLSEADLMARLRADNVRTAGQRAARFRLFVDEMAPGDVVVMPDTPRGEMVIGEIVGDYQYLADLAPDRYRHRRRVSWLGRHPFSNLPPGREELYRERRPLRELDAPDLVDHAERVRRGEVGRAASDRMRTRQSVLRRSIRWYFEDGNRDWAIEALRTYCHGRSDGDWLYSGAWFDRLAARTEPDSITARDLVAVTMLGVTVPARAAVRLLETERDDFSRLLREIGPDRPIWEADEAEFVEGSPADELWHRLDNLRDIGPVIAGKLMAAKRPSLIPVYDQHVHAALGWPTGQFWMTMRESMVEGHEAAAEAVKMAGAEVTALRAADIVVWMHQHGWTWAEGRLDVPPTVR